MQAEYENGLDTLGPNGMIFYKFISLFRAKGHSVSYGKLFTHENADPEVVESIRVWLKAQKEWIQTAPPMREMKHRMWWLIQTLMDKGLFDGTAQRHILFWYDSCTDALA